MSIFDFSGIELFLDIIDQLENDCDVSNKKWEELFQTSGYKILVKNEFTKTFLIENFKLVYMPKKHKELKTCLENDDNKKRYLLHYLKVKESKKEIKKQINYLKHSNILKEAINMSFQYLPKQKKYHEPKIAFVVFDNDARGYSTVVVDILLALGLKDKLKYLLAHELHHNYRNQITSFDYHLVLEEDSDLVYILNQIHLEGVADLIDKDILYYGENIGVHLINWAQKFKKLYDDTPTTIKEMNEILERIALKLGNRKELSILFRQLPKMSGHPLGYYMAKIILKHEGVQKLIDTVNNPFAFFQIYNKAAINDLKFSQDAMKVIYELDKKYVK